ncbi:hypothetical protein PR003_g4182 [Phytophthora rubi]|uniref:Uncharacterized protein n=1 Tax=Phytophthora rubi TaxID=129364 RepID=A0A6A3NM46_9STRA|nr:hypothetical protein PR002_g4014 [Phytophthora rubi]KAE9050416.1 hypothetical protein PR001_g2420 [Phytophthora rubi]KAE9352837.1 hypothetical protein PR003_g4182 [Phytophthora rubi]
MLQFFPLGLAPAFSEDASEIERYRTRQRLLSRGQPRGSPSPGCTEDSDAHDERRRKTSVKWQHRQQQQQHTLLGSQHEDGRWPEPAGTEMRVGFNAFDSSASPEVFDQAQKPVTQAETSRTRPCGGDNQRQGDCLASVERAVTSMGFPVLEWAPGLQHPSTLCAYVPLQCEDWRSHQRFGLYSHQPRYF